MLFPAWAFLTIAAAAAQTARNAMQRDLTGRLGTIGATHVRFLFGAPFALLFFAGLMAGTDRPLPIPPAAFWAWVAAGSLTQILATALMLATMTRRSFVVSTAYLKTEPIQVALFGLILLGDPLSPLTAAAIGIATLGVVLLSRPETNQRPDGWSAAGFGLAAAALFALSAVGFRGAITALPTTDPLLAAGLTLAVALSLQAVGLSLYLALRAPATLKALVLLWRPSLLAGLMGAVASQFWFLAFAQTSAAHVRTLALIEVPFAQWVAARAFRQRLRGREGVGIALILAGCLLLLQGTSD